MADCGRIDFYSFSERAAGLIFIGWVRPEAQGQLEAARLLVEFDDTAFEASSVAAFYPRELGNQGVGAILFAPAAKDPEGRPVSISVLGHDDMVIVPGENMQEFAASDPPHWLYDIITKRARPALPSSLVQAWFAQRREVGCLEVFGYEEVSQSWLFGGWLPSLPDDADLFGPEIRIANIECTSPATITFYRRDDLVAGGVGVAGMVQSQSSESPDLSGIELQYSSATFNL